MPIPGIIWPPPIIGNMPGPPIMPGIMPGMPGGPLPAPGALPPPIPGPTSKLEDFLRRRGGERDRDDEVERRRLRRWLRWRRRDPDRERLRRGERRLRRGERDVEREREYERRRLARNVSEGGKPG